MTDKYRIEAENRFQGAYQSGYNTLEEARIAAHKLAESGRVNVVVYEVLYVYKIKIIEESYRDDAKPEAKKSEFETASAPIRNAGIQNQNTSIPA